VAILPLAAITGIAAVAGATAAGLGIGAGALVLSCVAAIALCQVPRSRRVESLAYPVAGLALGLVFTTGLAMHLIRSIRVAQAAG
jgi:hypothetical protein